MAPSLDMLDGFEARHNKVTDADTSIKKPLKVTPDLDVIAGYEVYRDHVPSHDTTLPPHPLGELVGWRRISTSGD